MNVENTPNHPALLYRVGVIALTGTMTAVALMWWTRPTMESHLADAQRHLEVDDYTKALSAAENALKLQPQNTAALIAAGDAHFGLEQFDEALHHFEQVVTESSPESIHAMERAGRIHMHHRGNATEAERCFQSVLKRDEGNVLALIQMVSLLGIQARRQEAVPYILTLFRLGHFNEDFLSLLQSPDAGLNNKAELERYRRADPKNAAVLVGLAWHARQKKTTDASITLLERAIALGPNFAEPRVALAELLWQLDRISGLAQLLAEKESIAITDDARLWSIRGALAKRFGQDAAASRCYWEASRRDPADPRALFNLYNSTTTDGDRKNALLLSQQMQFVERLQDLHFAVVSQATPDWDNVKLLIEQLDRVGRVWEAWGWSAYAEKNLGEHSWASSRKQHYDGLLASLPTSQVCRPIAGLTLDYSHVSLPDWNAIESTEGVSDGSIPPIVFTDKASFTELSFRHQSIDRSTSDGLLMLQLNGSGVAVLDFDQDSWPDIYFTQACNDWPVDENSAQNMDQLFRNHYGERFSDVTKHSQLREDRFSTGVTVGDYNSDGFEDVYVANIGENRLLENNGDGTFTDVTDQAGVGDDRWSTSCVLADFSGDGLPDIYSVNYLTGDRIFERVCQHRDGRPRMCLPFQFDSEQDRYYVNLGDGRFQELTETCGIKTANGKGLGVVAADFDQDGKLSLFVANDTVANSYFANVHKQTDGRFFEERALTMGLAYNGDGKSEACMGVAAGDMDGDGDLDLYVTNFYSETNTLFRMESRHEFSDGTREAGLSEVSRDMLGFGTQFLDADLDGRLDLLVANGHIDDYQPYGRPYKMQPQFFWNAGEGRFLDSSDRAGDYFVKKWRGRAMARLDWNGDGREDVVITDMDAPAALLTNLTVSGNYLTVRLRGVQSAREAIGARVIVRVDGRSIARQLTAGDGYQASNQRQLVFGLGESDVVDTVDVFWPSGVNDTFNAVSANGEYIVAEGEGLYRLRNKR